MAKGCEFVAKSALMTIALGTPRDMKLEATF